MVALGLARHHRVENGSEALLLVALQLLVAFRKLRQHLAAEQLQRFHDVLVPVVAGLEAEDDLVDATLLVPREVLTDLIGRADRAAQPADTLLDDLGTKPIGVFRRGLHRFRIKAVLAPPGLKLVPHTRARRLVPAENVVVREGIAEEVRALDAAAQRFVLVLVAHERGHAGQVRVHGVADRHPVIGQRLVVVVDPILRLFGVDEGERERTDAVLGRHVNRVAPAARDPKGRVRLLARLGHDIARRHCDVLAREPGEGLLGHAAHRDAQPFLPHLPLVGGIDHEPTELGFRR